MSCGASSHVGCLKQLPHIVWDTLLVTSHPQWRATTNEQPYLETEKLWWFHHVESLAWAWIGVVVDTDYMHPIQGGLAELHQGP